MALISTLPITSCKDQEQYSEKNSTQEEELESQKVNYNLLAENMKKELLNDTGKLNKLALLVNKGEKQEKGDTKEVLEDFSDNLEKQEKETREQLSKLQDTKISNEEVRGVLLDKKSEFEEIIKAEVDRFDEEIKKYDKELSSLNTKTSVELRVSLNKQLAEIKKTREQMVQRLSQLEITGVEGYEKSKMYLQEIKNGFEQEAGNRLTVLNDSVKVSPIIDTNEIQDFNKKTDEISKLILESKTISVHNWQDIRNEIVNEIDELEKEFTELIT
mgnify:CR=1 FL=1